MVVGVRQLVAFGMSDEETHEAIDIRVDVPSNPALEHVAAYKLAREAGLRAWEDAKLLGHERLLAQVTPQLVRAVGSIAANIAEGYARRSPRDRIRFYEYALGSNEEASSWYLTARHAFAPPVLGDRTDRLTSIRRLLLVTIRNEGNPHRWNSGKR